MARLCEILLLLLLFVFVIIPLVINSGKVVYKKAKTEIKDVVNFIEDEIKEEKGE